MGRQWNPDSIPDTFDAPPPGKYLALIEDVEETVSKAGNLMYVGKYIIQQPVELHGREVRDYFTIGNSNDPNGEDPKTWDDAIGAKQLKFLMRKSRIPFQADLDDMIQQARGCEVGFIFTHKPEKDKATGGLTGNIDKRIASYFTVGERQPGLDDGAASPPPATTGGKVLVGGGESMPAGQTGATAKAIKPPPGANKPATAKAAKPKMVTCPVCNDAMEAKDYPAHASTHDDDGEE